mgnify:CR=1 FL=1
MEEDQEKVGPDAQVCVTASPAVGGGGVKGNVIIVGATAAIGKAVVREFARQGYGVVCCGRDIEEVRKVAADALLRYRVPVASYPFDALRLEQHERLFRTLAREQRDVVGMLVVHGYLDDCDSVDMSLAGLRKTVDVNYTSVVTATMGFVRWFRSEGNFVAVVGSVAGERGKKRNMVYSSAKSAVSTYLDGLRLALPEITVVEVRPGFIDTPMTYGNLPRVAFFVGTRETVARDVFSGILRKKKVVYTPFYWRYILFVLRNLPRVMYDRLVL